ncbi:aminotransferase class IV [Terrimonas pollutisoli]|uniref:aminotransferase class IV n=1 Tax=Terrimonas pollutisoli TaxID=3034147 RepID=UPI0023ED1851|nr:aminotransferase class IV [Terrimonas sp. H1YJ31]
MNYICLNGKIVGGAAPLLMADNRSYRYGDGLFETIKVVNKKISLESYHFERLFQSLAMMHFAIPSLFTPDKIRKEIVSLCAKNRCDELARVRFSVFRGNAGINESLGDLQYLIECWPLNDSFNYLNENGLVIDVCPDTRKSCDKFSTIKSANFLPYVMAALHAKENQLNDAIVLNVHGRIADSSVANIFIVKGDKLKTPSLSEGCVNGVMRKFLLDNSKGSGVDLVIEETGLSVDDLSSADEVFLTNAISGIKWVKRFRDKTYTNKISSSIFQKLLEPIWK